MYHIGAYLTSRSNLHDSSLGICDASLSATTRIQVLPLVRGPHTHETARPHGRCNSFPDRWNRVCVIMPRRSLPRIGTTSQTCSRGNISRIHKERLCACTWAMAIHRRASAEILTVRLESSDSRCFTRSRETLLGRASSGISTPSREFHTTMPSWLMSQTGSLLSPTLVKMLPNEAVVRKEHHAKWNLLKDLGSQ